MSAYVISQAIFYAISTEFSKQTIYITTKKIFELLSFWGAGAVAAAPVTAAAAVASSSSSSSRDSSYTINTKDGYNQAIRSFLIDNHIYLKLSIAEAIIRERTGDKPLVSTQAEEVKVVALDDDEVKVVVPYQVEEKAVASLEEKIEKKIEKKLTASKGEYESKAIEIACNALGHALTKIYKELELLKNVMEDHKQKCFYWARTPAYEKHLTKLATLMKTDFEVCFSWLERSVNCRKTTF